MSGMAFSRGRLAAWSGRLLLVAVWMISGAACSWAGGPRFVTPTFGCCNSEGQVEAFYTNAPLYFTDPGDLAAGVTHAQADAMVATAAAVWNVSTASLTLGYGGALAEHVSSGNTGNAYFDGTEMVFPADVQASNYASKQIAVIYDTDGSVTDLLLGAGASLPASCHQNAVTESVDGFGNSTIQHAMIILNGRCVGSAQAQLTQMQYQLARAFGRVLGLGWSQCNDNVFTAASSPTAGQLQNWPLMHPIDIACGPYTYQCMQNPFSLRSDDLSGLELLYRVPDNSSQAGKTPSLANGEDLLGYVWFPTGQGMDMINLVVHRQPAWWNGPQDWETASVPTGPRYQQNIGNPVTGLETGAENAGGQDQLMEGYWEFGWVETDQVSTFYIEGEPINPLYTGSSALGPFERPPAYPSGSPAQFAAWLNPPDYTWGANTTIQDAAPTCATGNDGAEGSPAVGDPSGWWSGKLCAYGHTSWWNVAAKAGRTWAVEVTALDDSGLATLYKVQPVIGVWGASDSTGTLPTVASITAAMNSMAPGVTQVRVPASSSDGSYRIAVADQFGAGRPDYNYKIRVLYADNVTPSTISSAGGTITITGTGFQLGNVVKINGVTAKVVSWSAQQIVAIAPAATVVGGTKGKSLSVSVSDSETGGSTTIASALSYSAVQNTIVEVSAPAALETGMASTTPFAARVLGSDGKTAVANDPVRLAVASGSASLAACGGVSSCTVTTDSTGLVQTAVTGGGAGTVALTAIEVSSGAQVVVTIVDTNPSRTVEIETQPIYVAAGASVNWSTSLQAMQAGGLAVAVPVTWTATGGLQVVATSGTTDLTGSAAISGETVGLAGGSANVVTGCVWSVVCASWTLYGVDPSLLQIALSTGGSQIASGRALTTNLIFQVTDGSGHAVQSATVTIAQTVDAAEGTCTDQGRCAAAPVLATSKTTAVTDANGTFSVAPMQVPGLPQVVNIAASVGTSGFAVLSLPITP